MKVRLSNQEIMCEHLRKMLRPVVYDEQLKFIDTVKTVGKYDAYFNALEFLFNKIYETLEYFGCAEDITDERDRQLGIALRKRLAYNDVMKGALTFAGLWFMVKTGEHAETVREEDVMYVERTEESQKKAEEDLKNLFKKKSNKPPMTDEEIDNMLKEVLNRCRLEQSLNC